MSVPSSSPARASFRPHRDCRKVTALVPGPRLASPTYHQAQHLSVVGRETEVRCLCTCMYLSTEPGKRISVLDLLSVDSTTIDAAESYRRRKATSVLCVIFTDIANSTALREERGEVEYEELRETYDDEVTAIVSHDDAGTVVKSTGDGLLCVFAEPSTAVERCLQIQRASRDHPLFRLRIGIDLGQVSVKTASGVVADVFGRQVNRAARIQSLAEPGHTLTSFNVYDCAVGWLRDPSICWAAHGLAILKGFKEPIAIHEVYDPTCSEPQSPAEFPRPEPARVMYSRSAVRPILPLPLGTEGWNTALLNLKSELTRLHEPWESEKSQQIAAYSARIATAIDRLKAWALPELTVLWIGESLRSGATVLSILKESPLKVVRVGSIEEALETSARYPFLFFVCEVGSDTDLVEALRFAKWQKTNPSGGPVLFHGSLSVEVEYEALSLVSGAALCSAGTATILNGVVQIMDSLQSKLPFKYGDERQVHVDPAKEDSKLSLFGRLKSLWQR